MVVRDIRQQQQEVGVNPWQTIVSNTNREWWNTMVATTTNTTSSTTMGHTMENTFPNFCLFLICTGVVSYSMSIYQLLLATL